MIKYIASFLAVIVLLINFSSADAATKKKKTKKSRSHKSSKRSSKHKTKRKSRHFSRQRGTGPDLKAMTTDSTDSPYKEDPNNGVNPIETAK
jgi:Flp pilus assembly protein TadB